MPDSDVDLLIIEDSTLPRYRRPVRYLKVLRGVFPAKDVVVYTPQEVEAWNRGKRRPDFAGRSYWR